MWTRFFDMCSGGSQKEFFTHCYIEAPMEEAKSIFYARFGHNPERVTCTCCGGDYSIRVCKELEQHLKEDDVVVIFAHEIDDEERNLTVPEQGYVWLD